MVTTEERRNTASVDEVGMELDLEHSRGLGLMEAIGEVVETRWLPNSELVEVVVEGGASHARKTNWVMQSAGFGSCSY